MTPEAVMVFAAGFGTRMGALTADRPKPLLPVAGKPLIDHALSLTAGIARTVVNLHYKGQMLADHLAGRGVALSWEAPDILDTGGGLRQALPMLGQGPVFTLNSDAVWTGANPLRELAAAWDPDRMDCLLLLLPAAQATGHTGKSDFILAPDGRIARAAGRPGEVYLGAQIVDPAGLSGIPDRVFSLNRLWDAAMARGRAFGTVHRGGWCDVGHPGGIALAEAMLDG
jgi:MurNAc alpha-1-phosphate uridylyltransferase